MLTVWAEKLQRGDFYGLNTDDEGKQMKINEPCISVHGINWHEQDKAVD